MISKSLSTSEKRSRLHQVAGRMAEFCQALYPLIVAHADDWGRLDGSTFHIKYAVDPTSPRPEKDFRQALTFLAEVGLIEWYDADGRKCLQVNDFDRHQEGLHKRTEKSSRKFPENPGNSLLREEKRNEENGNEQKGREAAPAAMRDLWNTKCGQLPSCREVTRKRSVQIAQRLSERSLDEWAVVIDRIVASDFCNGQNDRIWVATFDWLLQPETATKVLEGKYDNRKKAAQPKPFHIAGPKRVEPWEQECGQLHDFNCAGPSEHAERMAGKAAS